MNRAPCRGTWPQRSFCGIIQVTRRDYREKGHKPGRALLLRFWFIGFRCFFVQGWSSGHRLPGCVALARTLALEAQRAAAVRALADPSAAAVHPTGRRRGRRKKSSKSGVPAAWCQVPFFSASTEPMYFSGDYFVKLFSDQVMGRDIVDSHSRFSLFTTPLRKRGRKLRPSWSRMSSRPAPSVPGDL